MRANDSSILNADVQVGHDSTGWCNFANIAYKLGTKLDRDDAAQIKQSTWTHLLKETDEQLGGIGLSLDDDAIKLSPLMSLNEEGRFIGDNAEAANKLLKREYRKGFEVPEFAKAEAS